MTGRDRIVIMVVVVAAVLAAAWVEVVSPERQQASTLIAQVAAAQSRLASAESQVANARTAQSQYAAAYSAMVNLGKAVPPTQEVASLIDQLTRASDQRQVNFSSIASAGGSAASSPAASSVAAAGFTQLPFTFTFEGSYFDLEHLFRQLADFATLDSAGHIDVNGRLLTIRSVSLTPGGGSSTSEANTGNELTGSITATAYVLPASQGLTGATSAASPGAAAASPASSTPAASSPTSPAVVRVDQ